MHLLQQRWEIVYEIRLMFVIKHTWFLQMLTLINIFYSWNYLIDLQFYFWLVESNDLGIGFDCKRNCVQWWRPLHFIRWSAASATLDAESCVGHDRQFIVHNFSQFVDWFIFEKPKPFVYSNRFRWRRMWALRIESLKWTHCCSVNYLYSARMCDLSSYHEAILCRVWFGEKKT